MLVTSLFDGQGLGNQLATYITTRCIALNNGYEFGIQNLEKFKGKHFLNLDFGQPVIGGYRSIEGRQPEQLPDGITNYYVEKTIRHSNGCDISPCDPDLINVPDNTLIDGCMQGEDYFKKYKNEIRNWLKPSYMFNIPDNVCCVNFRGGEYQHVKDFFLPKSYWDNAIANMRKIRSDMKFHVVTDDPITARQFFSSDIPITHVIEKDYITIQSAKYLILSNSSFAIFPAYNNTNLKFCIYPRYFGRFNVSDGYWCMDQNYYADWWNQDHQGNLTKDK